ncbi:MAG: hypothetical protein KA974_10830 [Saprospiraceae bacterium]|nr:hypothetical protein [Saprospiraceae bacterium]
MNKNAKNSIKESFWLLLAGGIAGYFLPWWSLAIVTAIFAYFFRWSNAKAFGLGLAVGILLWSGYASILSYLNQGVLAKMIGELFGGLSGFQLIIITGWIGGILAGFGALTGSLFRNLTLKKV